jgi:hypothetical protein
MNFDCSGGDTAERGIEIDLRGEVGCQFVHAEANGFLGGHEGLFPGGDDHLVPPSRSAADLDRVLSI